MPQNYTTSISLEHVYLEDYIGEYKFRGEKLKYENLTTLAWFLGEIGLKTFNKPYIISKITPSH